MGGHSVQRLDFSRNRSKPASHRRRHQVSDPWRIRCGAVADWLGASHHSTYDNQLDFRVLGDNRDQGGRRYLRFRDAVALLRETEFEDWPHLGSRATKEFLTSIRDGSGDLENCHTNWVHRSGVSESSAVCHSHAILCESLRLFISYDQVDVSNLAGVEQIVRRIIQDERAVRKNSKYPD